MPHEQERSDHSGLRTRLRYHGGETQASLSRSFPITQKYNPL